MASPTRSENEFDISAVLVDANSHNFSVEDGETSVDGHPAISQSNVPEIFVADVGDEDDEDFIAVAQAASNRKGTNISKTVKRGGGFQAMGLNVNILKAITRKGFSVPTPIQRKTIPLVLAGQDVVGMARTGQVGQLVWRAFTNFD